MFPVTSNVVAWLTLLAVALGTGSPAFAADVTHDSKGGVPTEAAMVPAAVGETDALGLTEVLTETDDDMEADGDMEELTDVDGECDAEGETEGATEADTEAEGLLDTEGESDKFAEEAKVPHGGHPKAGPTSGLQGSGDAVPAGELLPHPAAAESGAEQSIKERAPGVSPKGPMGLFQLSPTRHGGETPEKKLIQRLNYQYSIGSESEITYRRNPDLNNRVQDNFLLLTPQVNGIVIYRPTDQLTTTLELILDREIAGQREKRITLPSGETQIAPIRVTSLLVDQAFVTIKGFTAPIEINAGRRNYEDERHWLYDTSMDIASISLKKGHVRAEASAGREVYWDLDLLKKEPTDRIDTYMLYASYRGIEDIILSGYTVFRNDRTRKEGRPLHMGVSAQGMPSEKFSFWTQVASTRGSDELKREFSAYAIDVGGTYRFPSFPFQPNVTLGFAFGTGDGNPGDNKNTEFRQTGLQSNEAKFAGVSKFKVFGETLDPELSNVGILTVGLGFRTAPNISVDLVYHRYQLERFADQIRNSALTALMNQDDTRRSKDMGSAFDIVLGFRNLFGMRRLGMDLRLGWFFPGKAFRIEEGDPDNPVFRDPTKGKSVVAKFWY